MRCDNVFVKKNQRLDLIFAKIICPARFVRRDPVAPFVDDFEIELRGQRVVAISPHSFAPKHLSGMLWPRRLLARLISSAHPDVFWRLKTARESSAPLNYCIRKFLQHLEHSFEITPHYDSPKNSIGPGIILQHAFAYRRRAMARPSVSPRFLRASTRKYSSGDPAMPVLRRMVQSKCVPLR